MTFTLRVSLLLAPMFALAVLTAIWRIDPETPRHEAPENGSVAPEVHHHRDSFDATVRSGPGSQSKRVLLELSFVIIDRDRYASSVAKATGGTASWDEIEAARLFDLICKRHGFALAGVADVREDLRLAQSSRMLRIACKRDLAERGLDLSVSELSFESDETSDQ